MRGVQLSGIAASRVRWSVAYGTPSTLSPGNADGKRQFFGQFHDVFARVSTASLSRGAGAFVELTDQPRSPGNSGSRHRGTRIGLDGTYFTHGYQLFAMPVYGEDDNPLGDGRKGVLRSGFVEADKMLTPWLGLNMRLEAQSVSVGGQTRYSDGKLIGLRIYPAPFVRLTAEFQQRDHGTSASSLTASTVF